MVERDRETLETPQGSTTGLSGMLVLLAILLSPLAYDLHHWMQEMLNLQ